LEFQGISKKEQQDKAQSLLEEFGINNGTYYETSRWFIIDNKKGYIGDLHHINTLSPDYNYIENEDKVLSVYKNEKRWEWESEKNMPNTDEIKYIGRFKTLK